MGLLDMLQSDDPAVKQGLLQFGLGLLSSKGNFGNALGNAGQQGLQGVMSYRDRMAQQQDREAQRKRGLLQDQLTQGQLTAQGQQQQAFTQQQADQQRQRDFLQNLTSPQMQASQTALAGGGGPTMANAAAMPPVDPQAQMLFGAVKAGAMPLQSYLDATRKESAPIKLGAGETLLAPGTFKPLASNPKEAAVPSAIQEYNFAKAQGYKGTFEQWDREGKKAGASSVNVPINMGQKGFDNTLKLRGDFRSEPIYKAHQEMQSAYAQIGQSLKQASPAGDLAGATKIMKLLDPGSVVRESELGMAMAATGLLDRVQNYASSVINGTKLTPAQRADFQKLADSLYSESVKQYNGKRAEYQGIAERNGLNVPDVLGSASTPSRPGSTAAASDDPLGLRK